MYYGPLTANVILSASDDVPLKLPVLAGVEEEVETDLFTQSEKWYPSVPDNPTGVALYSKAYGEVHATVFVPDPVLRPAAITENT